jgi:hypothetical protein
MPARGSCHLSSRSDFERPVVLQPTPACAAQYTSSEALFRGCEGAAQSDVFDATRGHHDRCGCVVFTKFDGAELPPDCGMGFEPAAALACFDALGKCERASQMDMQGWEEIGFMTMQAIKSLTECRCSMDALRIPSQ